MRFRREIHRLERQAALLEAARDQGKTLWQTFDRAGRRRYLLLDPGEASPPGAVRVSG